MRGNAYKYCDWRARLAAAPAKRAECKLRICESIEKCIQLAVLKEEANGESSYF